MAARRRAAVLLVLLLATGATWAVVAAASLGAAPAVIGGVTWVAAVPVSSLLLLDLLAVQPEEDHDLAGAVRRATGA